jgi:hypothetical protein
LTLVSVNNSYEYFPTLALVNITQIKKYDTPYYGVSEYFRKK